MLINRKQNGANPYQFRDFARKSDGGWSVLGPVMVPMEVDTQDEATEAEKIKEYAYEWMRSGRASKVDINHDEKPIDAVVVESFVPDEPYKGFKAGSWLVRIEGNDVEIGNKIDRGELNAFSWSGPYCRPLYLVLVSHALEAVGKSEKSDSGPYPEHDHDMTVAFKDDGKVKPTRTGETLGHWHAVVGTTRTEATDGHSHPWGINAE